MSLQWGLNGGLSGTKMGALDGAPLGPHLGASHRGPKGLGKGPLGAG